MLQLLHLVRETKLFMNIVLIEGFTYQVGDKDI